jgi:hypothetical protein
MAKAVIVIDVDEEDIGREVNYISVKGGGMSYIVGAKDSQVLIRPLPMKSIWVNDYSDGWNDCLDAITGETE